jgi:hypothetical protein
MRIRMLEERTGPRYDDRSWPPPGAEFDVPDEEGAGLCAQGAAVPVAVLDAGVETRADAPPEPEPEPEPGPEAEPEPEPEPVAEAEVVKPAAAASKADWAAYATARGMAEAAAQSATKNDLIAEYGG